MKDHHHYDDSIVVLLSDHGHNLMDSKDPDNAKKNGHGSAPYSHVSNILMAIKWPKNEENPFQVATSSHAVNRLASLKNVPLQEK